MSSGVFEHLTLTSKEIHKEAGVERHYAFFTDWEVVSESIRSTGLLIT